MISQSQIYTYNLTNSDQIGGGGGGTRIVNPKELLPPFQITPPVLKKLTFMTTTRSPKYNFDLLLLQKYLSNSDVYMLL
jgi:hypothetical protein